MSTKPKSKLKILTGSSLIPKLSDLNNISCKEKKNQIFIRQIREGSLESIKHVFDLLLIPYEINTQTTENDKKDPKSLIIKSGVIFPNVKLELVINILIGYGKILESENDINLISACSFIVSQLFIQVKFIGNHEELLNNLITSTRVQDKYREALQFLEQVNGVKVPIDTWLHLVRHPTKNVDFFIRYINEFVSMRSSWEILVTEIPLILEKETEEQKIFKILAITWIPDKEIDIKDQHDIKIIFNQNNILSYWFRLTSLILRNINFSVLKFKQLSLEGLDLHDIEFYTYFKSKLKLFSESCYNPVLVEAFKLTDSTNSKKEIEIYLYNRGSFLERNYREAEKDYNKKQGNEKILRKRYNKRKRRLFNYFNTILILYQPFLDFIAKNKLASGKYGKLNAIWTKREELKR